MSKRLALLSLFKSSKSPKKPTVISKPASTHGSQPPTPGGFVNGMMVGAAIGAAGYFLLGTKKGRKLKDELIELGKQQLAELEKKAQELPQLAVEVHKSADTVSKKVKKKSKTVKKQVDQELADLEASVRQAKQKADEMQQQLKQTATQIEKKFFKRKGKSLKK